MQCVETLSWGSTCSAGGTCGAADRAFGTKGQTQRDAAATPTSRAQGPKALAAPQGLGGKVLDIDGAQLIHRCIHGDPAAWAEMVRTHHRRVYGLCYRFTGNPADAE